MKYLGKQGKHDFKPRTPIAWYWKPSGFQCFVTFKDGSDYNMLPDTDHWDYSKLEGLAFSLLGNAKNSVMFGWSYDPHRELYRVVGYINDKGKHKFTPYIEVKKDNQITLSARVNKGSVDFDLNGTKFTLSISFKAKLGRRIGMWFGGNKPAPQDMEIWSTFQAN